jgi:hypothetical protein
MQSPNTARDAAGGHNMYPPSTRCASSGVEMTGDKHGRNGSTDAGDRGWFDQVVNDMRASEWWWSERVARVLVGVTLVAVIATVAGFVVSYLFF